MNISKLARIGLITTAIGAISLSGIYYASEYTNIGNSLADLKDLALRWQGVAKDNKDAYDALKTEHDTLSKNFAEILKILGMDSGASIEQVKTKLQNIVDNANATGGIEGANNMLEAIADGLGIELTQKHDNGIWKTDEIIAELNKIDNSLDELQTALGQYTEDENGKITITIDKNAKEETYQIPKLDENGKVMLNDNGEIIYEEVTYYEDMTLTQKINYLIGQINKANSEQVKIKEDVQNALEQVDKNLDEYTVNKEEEEPKEEQGGDMTQSGGDPNVAPTAKEQAWNALETSLRAELSVKENVNVDNYVSKIKNGNYSIKQDGRIVTNDDYSDTYVSEETYNLYQAWVNAQ